MNGTIETKAAEGKLILKISNKLDSNFSPEAERICREAISRYTSDNSPMQVLEIDLEDCVYISSSGIRVLMNLYKLCRNSGSRFRVINVSEAVFEVLNMTGMNMAFPVYQKPRQIEKEGLELVGTGTTGTVYKLDADKVLKVFHASYSLERIYNEQEITRKIASQGIPCAIPYDIVRVGESYGLIFEFIEATSAAEKIKQAVKAQDYAAVDNLIESFANYARTIHQNELPDHYLPDIKKRYYEFVDAYKNIMFDTDDYQYIMDLLDEIPDTNQFLHGDLNFENIVFSSPDMILIDVAEAKQGNPVFDMNIYRSLYYLGKVKKEIYEQMGIEEGHFVTIIKRIEELYYSDLSEAERIRKYRQLNTTSVLRLLMLMAETVPKEVMYSEQVKEIAKIMYTETLPETDTLKEG